LPIYRVRPARTVAAGGGGVRRRRPDVGAARPGGGGDRRDAARRVPGGPRGVGEGRDGRKPRDDALAGGRRERARHRLRPLLAPGGHALPGRASRGGAGRAAGAARAHGRRAGPVTAPPARRRPRGAQRPERVSRIALIASWSVAWTYSSSGVVKALQSASSSPSAASEASWDQSCAAFGSWR